MTDSATATMADMTARARKAAATLATASTEQKRKAIHAAANAMRQQQAEILAANAKDMEAGKANNLTSALLDRLLLNEQRIEGIASALDAVAELDDPVGQSISEWSRPNGLKFERVRVPIGVIGIIYESRPNVTADAGALCLMAGNAAILRSGSEAINSARAIHKALTDGVAEAGLPADAIQLVQSTDRALVGAMLAAHDGIDLIIPRGGKSLVARVQNEARVPVLAHLDGICHVYVDGSADPEMAKSVAHNAKMRRPGICGAMETLLIDKQAAHMAPAILGAIADAGCEIRATPDLQAIDSRFQPVSDEDWDTEYLDSILSVTTVDGVEGAIAHIARHGSHHTDSIITEDQDVANRFMAGVDSAIVAWNASTQFADGGEFGFGAEIGIATGRLHARGPVALEGLTTYKTLVRGKGQIRPA